MFVPNGAKVDIYLGHLSGNNNVDRANVKADLGHGRSQIAVVYSISLGWTRIARVMLLSAYYLWSPSDINKFILSILLFARVTLEGFQ